jgi:hypothetical protein
VFDNKDANPFHWVYFDGAKSTLYAKTRCYEPNAVVATYDDNNAVTQIYSDGAPKATSNVGNTWNPGDNCVTLGWRSVNTAGANYGWDGEVYSIRLYNRALTPEEVARNHAIDVLLYYGIGLTLEQTRDVVFMHRLGVALADVSLETNAVAKEATKATIATCVGGLEHVIRYAAHEDMTSLRRSFDEAYFCCHVLQLGFLKLLHGTALREKAAEYGIVAMGAAPYAVLKTNWLSFEELRRLHDMAELLDRLRERGRFERALNFLMPKLPSPFDFYMDFLTYLQETTGKAVWEISQRDLFSHLAVYGEKLLYPQDGATFRAFLREDYATAEVRRAPKELI